MASFFYFGHNFLSKPNPQSILIEEFNPDPDIVHMDPNSFLITFALENITNSYATLMKLSTSQLL